MAKVNDTQFSVKLKRKKDKFFDLPEWGFEP